MNKKQILVLVIAFAVIAGCFVFPPWATLVYHDTENGKVILTHAEHRLFNDPPEPGEIMPPFIQWRYPIQNSAAVAAVAAALCFFLRTRKTRQTVQAPQNCCPGAVF